MDYKEKNKEEIIRATQLWECGDITRENLEYIFPELAESEEEMIRKWIIDDIRYAINNEPDNSGYKKKAERAIAWLEKQSKQKSIDYAEELKKCRENPLYFFDKYVKVKIKEQKPVWNEEDMSKIQRICMYLNEAKKYYADINEVRECMDWLKSLRPQNRWKPSNEQIKVCKEVYADILSTKGFDLGTINDELNRLEEELKKLK